MPAHTPLFDVHRRLGARLVDFAGWAMPVSYGNATDEHRAVRERCGLFDVSHMGELALRGPGADAVWQRLTTNDVRRLEDGDCQYSLACTERGGIIDDLILYRRSANELFAVVNAAHTAVVSGWIDDRMSAADDASLIDESTRWALLALQGPAAFDVLAAVAPERDREQGRFTLRHASIGSIPVELSRTGYTGEDGVEIFVPANEAVTVWSTLLAAVLEVGGVPAGLAARDTLRLEAALPLCGTDMDESTTPLEASLGWAVRFADGNAFIGREALESVREAGPSRRLVCFEMIGAGVPRSGYEIHHAGQSVGRVTSGAKSPSLGRFIGMGYVTRERAAVGTDLEVVIRGRPQRARVVRRPFYRRDG